MSHCKGRKKENCTVISLEFGWLVVLGLVALWDSISVYIWPSPRDREKEERKMPKQPPTSTYCKRNRPLPYYHPNCRMPGHWKFTQDHRTIQAPLFLMKMNPFTFKVIIVIRSSHRVGRFHPQLLQSFGWDFNPFALRMAKTLWSFGHSECKRVKLRSCLCVTYVLVGHYTPGHSLTII